ncbi:hypothetical protein THO17_07190 [Marinomonas sp. THO17]
MSFVSLTVSANDFEKSFSLCLDYKIKGSSNFDKDVFSCGSLIQSALDKNEKINSDAALKKLNNEIKAMNKRYNKNVPLFSIYKDSFDEKSLRALRDINYLRENIYKYKSLSYDFNNLDSFASFDDMKWDLARSNTRKAKTYNEIESSVANIKSKAPSFDIAKYEDIISKIHSKYEVEDSASELIFEVISSIDRLKRISDYTQVKGSNNVRKDHWKKVVSVEVVEKLSSKAYFKGLKPTFDSYFDAYQNARMTTESNFLTKFLFDYYNQATIFDIPDSKKYYTPEPVEEKMYASLKTLKKELNDWHTFLPDSDMINKYRTEMPKTESITKAEIQKGHEKLRERVLSDLHNAEVPRTNHAQNRVEQDMVSEVASSYFSGGVPFIDVMGRKVKSQKVISFPIQTGDWTLYRDSFTNLPIRKAADYEVVVQDDQGGCHAVSLRIRRDYFIGDVWGDVSLGHVYQIYPLLCEKI